MEQQKENMCIEIKTIIDNNSHALCEETIVSPQLLNKLVQAGLITKPTSEEIGSPTTNYKRADAFWSHFRASLNIESLNKFRECLQEEKMSVEKYFSQFPSSIETANTTQSSTSKPGGANQTSNTTTVTTNNPSNESSLPAADTFKNKCRSDLDYLCNNTDMSSELLVKMKDKKLITENTMKEIANIKLDYNRACKMYDIIQKKATEKNVQTFFTCLNETGNEHVVDYFGQ